MTRSLNAGVVSGVLAGLAVAAAYVGTGWALQGADGVSLVAVDDAGASTYRTDFIDTPAYLVAAGVALLVTTAAARLSWPPAVTGLLAAVLVLARGAAICVDRYAVSGWSDGLELSIYVVPLMAAVVGLALITLARLWRPA